MIRVEEDLSKSLDGLRGLAALIVFLVHLNDIYVLPLIRANGFIQNFATILSSYAVMVFFVLSGFVITASALKFLSKDSFSSLNFFKKRLIRIYPPFIFSLLLAISVGLVIKYFELHGSESYLLDGETYAARKKIVFDVNNYIYNLFMYHGFHPAYNAISINGPLWSVSYEWWFYIILILFIAWWDRRRVWLSAVPLCFIVLFLYHQNNTKFLFLISVWLLGALSAYIHLYQNRLQPYKLLPIFITIMILIVREIYKDWEIILPFKGNKSYFFQFLCVVVLLLLMNFKPFMRVFSINFLCKMSKYSYTLYVIHFPLLLLSYSFLHKLFSGSSIVIKIILLGGVCFAVILISYLLAKVLENTSLFDAWISRTRLRKPWD